MKPIPKSKPEKIAPYRTPFSPYALFSIALNGYDLIDSTTGTKVYKWEVFFRHQSRPDIIAQIKERKDHRYLYVKNR
jgi:hypothetical protein